MTHLPACDISDCGNTRCDDCGERMTCLGPEPRPCLTVCVDCECRCDTCDETAQDRQDERAYEIARDNR